MELNLIHTKIIFSLLTLFSMYSFKTVLYKFVPKRPGKLYIRNFVNLTMAATLVIIWLTEIREFTFSMVAIAAALAIATKEYILCIMGGFHIIGNRLFKVGDRIEIGENLGDVIDNTISQTKILEVGPKGLSQQYTGRVINIPNGLFLSQSVFNLTSSKEYSFHVFKHPIKHTQDILIKKKIMFLAALKICSPYLDKARQEIQHSAIKEGLEPPKIKPVVSLHFSDSDNAEFIVRVPVPVKMRGHYQQKILHQYLERIGQSRSFCPKKETANFKVKSL